MTKDYFKKLLPTRETVLQNKRLTFLHPFFDNTNLWHFNCHSVATAVSLGFFIGYLPIPGHMILSGLAAVAFEANFPLAIAMVWVSNPITIPPMFYLAYRVGAFVLHTPVEPLHIEANYHWLIHELGYLGFPTLVGAVLCGAVLAIMGNISVRIYYYFRL